MELFVLKELSILADRYALVLERDGVEIAVINPLLGSFLKQKEV